MAGSGVATEETTAEFGPLVAERWRLDGPAQSLAAPDTSPAFHVRMIVGRLLEIQLFHLRNVEQERRLSECVRRETRRAPSRAVIFEDCRRTSPFSQDVGDGWARSMRAFNEHLAFCAILLAPSNGTFNLQLERVVRCAGNPGRQLFCDKRELYDWLAVRATSHELARLNQLLRE